MKKTVKKLDNNLVKALTQVCEEAKQQIFGFEWLTHTADYSNFPASLQITCVFDTQQSVSQMQANQQDQWLRKQIHSQLLKAGILLKNAKQHIFHDSEEACLLEHNGDWKRRLAVN
ncbi:Fis family transcriptional regulator [Paraglaciecola aestuariivivens]